MAYPLKIPKEQMQKLFLLREYGGCGSIASQVREAIKLWVKEQERKIGAPIEDIAEVFERHRKEDGDFLSRS